MKSMRKISALLIMLCILFGAVFVPSVSAETTQDDFYRSRFLELVDLSEAFDERDKACEVVYKYYSNPTSADEATPDYVMANVFVNPVSDILVNSYLEEYVLCTGPYRPYLHGYHIYVPSEDKVYTLEEAYYADIEGIEEAFKSRKYTIALVGDCDANYELNVKDATCVQKHIADLDVPKLKFWEKHLVYDFNRDENVNIKDATAIQKHIAGIEV